MIMQTIEDSNGGVRGMVLLDETPGVKSALEVHLRSALRKEGWKLVYGGILPPGGQAE